MVHKKTVNLYLARPRGESSHEGEVLIDVRSRVWMFGYESFVRCELDEISPIFAALHRMSVPTLQVPMKE